ncbi:hypothetical protein CBOM_00494 [Ceraceosorus bombacis]|uniref:Uncharacterized protein n=1 Tax=Ceraceosorus bombacis TaxID=401625 RepID=A0A0P1B966_9BASI|nr:hypothetical protein CBOM_00494 [Ceraceosorus bombacis]
MPVSTTPYNRSDAASTSTHSSQSSTSARTDPLNQLHRSNFIHNPALATSICTDDELLDLIKAVKAGKDVSGHPASAHLDRDWLKTQTVTTPVREIRVVQDTAFEMVNASAQKSASSQSRNGNVHSKRSTPHS